MSKFVNDVRASSADSRYAGKPFQGTIAQIKVQAAKAPDPGVPRQLEDAAGFHQIGVARYELLKFLRVLP